MGEKKKEKRGKVAIPDNNEALLLLLLLPARGNIAAAADGKSRLDAVGEEAEVPALPVLVPARGTTRRLGSGTCVGMGGGEELK